jgi:hypothetical protein
MPNKTKTWAETMQQANTLDEIIDLITRSLSDSRINNEVIVAEIIGTIEERIGHKFERTARFIPRTVQ